VKTINGGWDNSLKKEYIFKRINDWLIEYFGENHGITCGISEWGPSNSDPNIGSVVYGSLLGTFANNGVEYLTPWNWTVGMWETLHLFSRYSKSQSVSSISSLENTVSAYTSLNQAADSMTVIIVNRDLNSERNVTVNLNECIINDGNYTALHLSSLPSTETFISHAENALTENAVEVNSNSFTITVPALSTTAVLLSSIVVGLEEYDNQVDEVKLYPNPVSDQLYIKMSPDIAELMEITVYDQSGRKVQSSHVYYDGNSPVVFTMSALSEGFYFLSVKSRNGISLKSFSVIR
jgi:hypothetical protein